MEKYKPSYSVMVPVMIGMTVATPEAAKADLSSLKGILYGASPMNESLLLSAMKIFPNVAWVQGYG